MECYIVPFVNLLIYSLLLPQTFVSFINYSFSILFKHRKELDFNLEFKMIREAGSRINKSMFIILLGLGERDVFYG